MARAKPGTVWGALAANARILRAGPRVLLFLQRYMKKFRIRNAGGHLIIHSHLPPINSPSYARFIDEHLLGKTEGPSHAQIALTNLCPQKCAYCYNRERAGVPMDTEIILRAIADLKETGVFWLGFTGGEPLLNRDIVRITAAASPGCAVKLFTTGTGLDKNLAAALRDAGLFSVSVSLDHWKEDLHDQSRGTPGAYRTARRAIEIFQETGGLDVGVSAVLSKDMLKPEAVEYYLDFLAGLGIDEAWLSEAKPSVPSLRRDDLIITREEHLDLVSIQDRRNRKPGMTVNYLGHFESDEHFGCNAGTKMVYIDPFGEVSPCVFAPMTFGNVRTASMREILADMKSLFRPAGTCFMNVNHRLFQDHRGNELLLSRDEACRVLKSARFSPPPAFHGASRK